MPKPIRALLIATAFAASGCTSDAGESELATTSASSAPAGPTVTIIGEAPVMTRELIGGTAAYLLPSAFSFEGGMYHAWVVAFGEEPGDQRPIHLTSTDATSWEVANADLLTELGVEYSRPGPIPSSLIAGADDAWTMHFWGTEAPDEDRPHIWRATAGDPLGPWTVDPEPALSRGPIEAWDGRSVEFPSVVATEDGYLMVYDGSGYRGPPAGSLGVATSTDGVSWTKVADPVMTPGFCGAFDRAGLSQGRPLPLDDGGYLMPYGGHDGGDVGASIGLARSPDGMTWTCVSSEPILVAADIPVAAASTPSRRLLARMGGRYCSSSRWWTTAQRPRSGSRRSILRPELARPMRLLGAMERILTWATSHRSALRLAWVVALLVLAACNNGSDGGGGGGAPAY